MRSAKYGLRNKRVPLVLAVVSLLFLSPGLLHAELIDRVVASVNNDVITLAELNQAVNFNAAVSGGGNSEALRRETLEGFVNRRLILREANRFRLVEVSEQDIDAEIGKLRKRLGSDEAFAGFLSSLAVTGEQLRRMLNERLLVERFIEKKIGLFIRVSRSEVQDFFSRRPDRFSGKRLQDVQEPITAELRAQKLDQQLIKYLAELRSKADVRVKL